MRNLPPRWRRGYDIPPSVSTRRQVRTLGADGFVDDWGRDGADVKTSRSPICRPPEPNCRRVRRAQRRKPQNQRWRIDGVEIRGSNLRPARRRAASAPIRTPVATKTGLQLLLAARPLFRNIGSYLLVDFKPDATRLFRIINPLQASCAESKAADQASRPVSETREGSNLHRTAADRTTAGRP